MVSMIVFLNFLIHKLEESGDRYFLLSRGSATSGLLLKILHLLFPRDYIPSPANK